eukprot:4223979-Pleurochrysis_carterae.AAC.1
MRNKIIEVSSTVRQPVPDENLAPRSQERAGPLIQAIAGKCSRCKLGDAAMQNSAFRSNDLISCQEGV